MKLTVKVTMRVWLSRNVSGKTIFEFEFEAQAEDGF